MTNERHKEWQSFFSNPLYEESFSDELKRKFRQMYQIELRMSQLIKAKWGKFANFNKGDKSESKK